MQEYFADFIIRDKSERPLAVVEIKGDFESSRERASQLRRNILMHAAVAEVPFFLFLTPSVGYLWKPNPLSDATDSLSRLPDAEFSTSEIMQHYLPEPSESPRRVHSVLELIFFQWLSDLAAGSRARDLAGHEALAETGFLEAIRGANIILDGWFFNRNWKDFNDPWIIDQLHRHNCRYVENLPMG